MRVRRFDRLSLALAGVVLASSIVGCGFLANLTGACDSIQCERRKYYRGVYMDTQFWQGLSAPELMPIQKMVGYTATAIDFPITAVLDTLAVPFIAVAPDDSPPSQTPAKILEQ